MLRIAAGYPEYIFHIPAVHANDIVVLTVIGSGHLNCAMALYGNPHRRKLPFRARVNRISNFFRAGGSGIY